MKVEHEIAVVRRGRIAEGQCADALPAAEVAPLSEGRSARLAVIGYFDVERGNGQCPKIPSA